MDDYAVLSAIKSDAYLRFGGAYTDRPFSEELFSRHIAQGNITVVVDPRGAPCGYSLAFPIGGDLFLHHLFVKKSYGGLGLGVKLLTALAERTETNQLRAITLCTARDVTWNAPYYSRHGFILLSDEKMPEYLKGELERDRRHFVSQNPLVQRIPALACRVAMEKPMP